MNCRAGAERDEEDRDGRAGVDRPNDDGIARVAPGTSLP